MTLVASVGDIHASDRPPSIRTDTYTEDIIAKLKFIVQTAAERGCDVIVLNGDVFHIKTPTRNSHALVQRIGAVLTSTDLEVWVVPGNHDLSNDRLDSLPRQPLGTLAKMTGINLLMGGHPALPIFGLPYLHDWENELPKWMYKYEKWADARKGEEFDFWPLMITHAPIFPAGEEPPYDFIPAPEWAGMMNGKGDCIYGHIHDPHGTYKPLPHSETKMCNNGAISRGSLHEATLKRKPKFTIWDSSTSSFEAIEIPHRPVEAVFRLHVKEDVDEKNSRVEEFLESVGKTTLEGLSIEEVVHQAKVRGLSDRTRSLVTQLLEEVS